MKDRKKTKSGMIWLMLSVLLAIAMVFSQTTAWAQVNCGSVGSGTTTDYDADGFTDYEECYGICLNDGNYVCGSAGCPSICTNTNRLYPDLDPNKKDLFVIWVPAVESPFQIQDPLEYVSDLLINVHLITEAQATNNANYMLDRIVSPTSIYQQQKAVRVTESLESATDTNIMGNSYEGTPLDRDNGVVYTVKIKNHILSVSGCPDLNTCTSCYDPSGQVSCLNLFYKYVKQTIAHEIGHMVGPLAPVSARDRERYGGYHYKSGTNVIMDQSVYYTIKGNKATFYIGTTYTSIDKEGIKLK